METMHLFSLLLFSSLPLTLVTIHNELGGASNVVHLNGRSKTASEFNDPVQICISQERR